MVVNAQLQARLQRAGVFPQLAAAGVRVLAPQGYVETLALLAGAGAVLTDSPVAEAEAQEFGVPCYLFTGRRQAPTPSRTI